MKRIYFMIVTCCSIVSFLVAPARGATDNNITVKLRATIKSVRAYSGSSPIQPLSTFVPGSVVAGTFSFDLSAVDYYPENPNLGYYSNGLKSFSISISSTDLHWESTGGLAQIQNDCDYLGNDSPGYDRVRFASYPSYGLTGSTIDQNQVVTVDIDVHEVSWVPPDPEKPLLSSDIPTEGYLLFDAGALELQWHEGSDVISTYLDFEPTPSVRILNPAPLILLLEK